MPDTTQTGPSHRQAVGSAMVVGLYSTSHAHVTAQLPSTSVDFQIHDLYKTHYESRSSKFV